MYSWQYTVDVDQSFLVLALIEQIISLPKAKPQEEFLPIHPYFLNPESQADISVEELSTLYFGCYRPPALTPLSI